MLSWIPFVGPIIDGVVSIFTKMQDTSLGKYKVDGDVAVQTIKSGNEVTLAFINEIPVRIARDMIMFPGSAWCGLYIWDKIVNFHYPQLVFKVASLDGPMVNLPFALMAFFFGVSAMNIWKR